MIQGFTQKCGHAFPRLLAEVAQSNELLTVHLKRNDFAPGRDVIGVNLIHGTFASCQPVCLNVKRLSEPLQHFRARFVLVHFIARQLRRRNANALS